MNDLADRADMASEADLFCPHCHYNLRGIDSERCPECGTVVDRAALLTSLIPWTHRRRIGWVRAYIKTLWMATVQPGQLGAESARPVSYRDARLFRVVTLILASLPILAMADLWTWSKINAWDEIEAMVERPGDLAVTTSGWLIALVCATGMGAWFARPRGLPVVLQNRAVALSQYACAPLALLLPFGVAAWLADGSMFCTWSVISGVGREGVLGTMVLAAGFAVAGILLAWWWSTLVLLRAAARAGFLRLAAAGVLLPLLGLAFLAVWGFGLHLLVMFMLVCLHSVRA